MYKVIDKSNIIEKLVQNIVLCLILNIVAS